MKKNVISLTVISTVMTVFLVSAQPSQAFSLMDFFRGGSTQNEQAESTRDTSNSLGDKIRTLLSTKFGVGEVEAQSVADASETKILTLVSSGLLSKDQADPMLSEIKDIRNKQDELKNLEKHLAESLKTNKVDSLLSDLRRGINKKSKPTTTVKPLVTPNTTRRNSNPVRVIPR